MLSKYSSVSCTSCTLMGIAFSSLNFFFCKSIENILCTFAVIFFRDHNPKAESLHDLPELSLMVFILLKWPYSSCLSYIQDTLLFSGSTFNIPFCWVFIWLSSFQAAFKFLLLLLLILFSNTLFSVSFVFMSWIDFLTSFVVVVVLL